MSYSPPLDSSIFNASSLLLGTSEKHSNSELPPTDPGYSYQYSSWEHEVGDRLRAFSSQPDLSRSNQANHKHSNSFVFAKRFQDELDQNFSGPTSARSLPQELPRHAPSTYFQKSDSANDSLLSTDSRRPLVGPLPAEDFLASGTPLSNQQSLPNASLKRNIKRKLNPRDSRNGNSRDSQNSAEPLTGFIVADSHFGWENSVQPSNETIRDRIRHINERFPDLDVFWDAGDAHHNADDNERGAWLTYLAGEVPQTPFYFTAGNHEVDNYSGPYDPEARTQQLGSVNIRPYYSVDIKNIHIISLPELIDVNYLSAESLAWLKLDLQLNQDKTVIIVSHNALSGTTSSNNRSVYREVVNSDVMFDLMRQYPNIRAWVHGHNHTYEVVQQDGTLFVSAGRMGGFNGDRKTDLGLDDDNLGGIYFKVEQNTLTMRAYNASKEAFMDELGYPGLSKTLTFETSLDDEALPSLSYGYGLARRGQRIPGYNHHLKASQRELFIGGSPSAAFNDNPRFTSFQQDNDRGKQLNGVQITPQEGYEWLDPGVRLIPHQVKDVTTVSTSNGVGTRWTYYRAAPKHRYMAVLRLDDMDSRQQVRLQAKVHDSDGNLVKTLPSKALELTPDTKSIRYSFKVPALKGHSNIYTDITSDRQLQLSVQAKFQDIAQPITLKAFKLRLKGRGKKSLDPALIINEKQRGVLNRERYQHSGSLGVGDYARFDLPVNSPRRSVFEARAKGSGLVTFLVRETGLKWQVRNGTATRQNGDILIGPKRNQFGSNREILVTPMGRRSLPYLNRLTNVEKARLSYNFPGNQSKNKSEKDSDIEIKLVDVTGKEGGLVVVTQQEPQSVEGATEWTFQNGLLEIVAIEDALVKIDF